MTDKEGPRVLINKYQVKSLTDSEVKSFIGTLKECEQWCRNNHIRMAIYNLLESTDEE